MSLPLISPSPDLARLLDEGYHLEIRSGYLLIHDVPYVNSSRQVKRGTLVSTLSMAGDIASKPDTHVATFIGEYPCTAEGVPLEAIRHSGEQQLADNLAIDFMFSSKLHGGVDYSDYHQKMTAYVAILETHAQAIDPSVTARTNPVVLPDLVEGVFNYLDTATSRAGIGVANEKLELGRVAIVGLGGTGAYVLDLVAKTPVREIHLFDDDLFLSHNAFRAPGAASVEVLRQQPLKVQHWTDQYSVMRRGIVPHALRLQPDNIGEIVGFDFVFLCLDSGAAKLPIVERLEAADAAFIDVGMGIHLNDGALGGIVRTTTSLPGRRDYFRSVVSLADTVADDIYDQNIQVAELNALNATLAVVRWKKLYGFYRDFGLELDATYTIDTNMLLNGPIDEN